MKKIISIMFAAVCFTMLTACGSDDAEVDVLCTLYGTVTDFTTGEPVDKATVTLMPGGKSTITGSDGTYIFDNNIADGTYKMTVQKNGYDSNYKQVTAIPGSKVAADIMLKRSR